jgi:hypothetical protein
MMSDVQQKYGLQRAIDDAVAFLDPEYRPLGARMVSMRRSPGDFIVDLDDRASLIRVRLFATAAGDLRGQVAFSCEIRPASLAAIRALLPHGIGWQTVLGPVVLGREPYEDVEGALAEAYQRIVHRKDVQAAIRRDPHWHSI